MQSTIIDLLIYSHSAVCLFSFFLLFSLGRSGARQREKDPARHPYAIVSLVVIPHAPRLQILLGQLLLARKGQHPSPVLAIEAAASTGLSNNEAPGCSLVSRARRLHEGREAAVVGSLEPHSRIFKHGFDDDVGARGGGQVKAASAARFLCGRRCVIASLEHLL